MTQSSTPRFVVMPWCTAHDKGLDQHGLNRYRPGNGNPYKPVLVDVQEKTVVFVELSHYNPEDHTLDRQLAPLVKLLNTVAAENTATPS